MTDEPLGSHVLELQVADVVEETDDARSLVFTVPDGPSARYPGRAAALCARPVPDAARAQRPHRLGGPLLLAVQLAVHRRPADRHRQAHRRRLRVELAVRQRPCRHEDPRARAVGHLRAQDARHRLPAAGRGQRHHADDGDLQVGARRGQRQGGADLRQPRRELGDLRRRAARTGRQVPRPADRRALAGIACRGCRARPRWPAWPRPYTGRDAYICGPGPFMAAAEEALEDAERARRRRSTSRCSSRWSPTRSPRS